MSAAAAGAAAKAAGQKISNVLSSWGFWAVVFVAGFAAWFYFKGRRKGKDAASAAIKQDLVVPVNAKLVTQGGKTWDPQPFTDNLHNDIYASWYEPRDTDPYEVLNAMSDEKLKMVHNDWLNRYFDKDKETLKVAISNESVAKGAVLTFGQIKEQLLARFTNLGLK